MTKPRWDDMTREELLNEKALWETWLQETNLILAEVKRRAHVDKVYMPSREFEALLAKRAKLIAGLRGISTLLAIRKCKPFSDYFYEAADELIDDGALFDRIYNLAESLRDAAQRRKTDGLHQAPVE